MDVSRWGLSMEAIASLGRRLEGFWRYYGQWTRTQTRNTSHYGLSYLKGLLRMKTDRNMAEIAREADISEQNIQHFISNSPWSGSAMIAQVQQAIGERNELQAGVLILDESADVKSGESSAGAARQHNGRLGKIDQSQVGVYLGYAKDRVWTLVEGELFLPEKWFSKGYAARRRKAEIPSERVFQTKIQLGWQMIERAQAAGVSFVAVAFDSLYGRSFWLRGQCDQAGIEYYADVPANQQLYLEQPVLEFELDKRGQPDKKFRVVGQTPCKASDLAQWPETEWERLTLRPNERGMLIADFAMCSAWVVSTKGDIREETLLMKRNSKEIRYSLSNAPSTTPLLTLAQRKCQRYFVERSIQDAKSELGMDEFQAIKYRAWEHHLALTLLASWFIAETRLDWQEEHPRDASLLEDYETDVLPALSMANVREMLRATLPLRQLSPLEAANLVVKHLDNRTRSRRSRLRKHSGP
jgi:SRSO17 transposase